MSKHLEKLGADESVMFHHATGNFPPEQARKIQENLAEEFRKIGESYGSSRESQ